MLSAIKEFVDTRIIHYIQMELPSKAAVLEEVKQFLQKLQEVPDKNQDLPIVTELLKRVQGLEDSLTQTRRNFSNINKWIQHFDKRLANMAATQAQVLTALTTSVTLFASLQKAVNSALQAGTGAPDEQPVLDQVNKLNQQMTDMLASLPGAQPGPAQPGSGTGSANTTAPAGNAAASSSGESSST